MVSGRQPVHFLRTRRSGRGLVRVAGAGRASRASMGQFREKKRALSRALRQS